MSCPLCKELIVREYQTVEPFTPRSLGGDVVVFAFHQYTKCEGCGEEYVTPTQARFNEDSLQREIDQYEMKQPR